MKLRFARLFVPLLLIAVAGWLSCGDDSSLDVNDPSTLAGSYDLESLTDKSGDIAAPGTTFRAGEATQVQVQGVTANVTLTGQLTLTETRYTFSQTFVIEVPGFPTQTETSTDTGTYSVSNGQITINSDDPQEPTLVANLSSSGNSLIIDDTDQRIEFKKR